MSEVLEKESSKESSKGLSVAQTKPISVISISKKATLDTITEVIAAHPERVMAEVEKYGLIPDGPMIFVYRNCTSDMAAPFDVEMSQPVKNIEAYKGDLDRNTLEPIHYVQKQYLGSLEHMGAKGYEPFMAELQASELQMTDQCREIYTNFETYDSAKNIVEIQMGVQV